MRRLRSTVLCGVVAILLGVAIWILRSREQGAKAEATASPRPSTLPNHQPKRTDEASPSKDQTVTVSPLEKPTVEDCKRDLQKIVATMKTAQEKLKYLFDFVLDNPRNVENDTEKAGALEVVAQIISKEVPSWLNQRLRAVLVSAKGPLTKMAGARVLGVCRSEKEDYQILRQLLAQEVEPQVRAAAADALSFRSRDKTQNPSERPPPDPLGDEATSLIQLLSAQLRAEGDPSVRAKIVSSLGTWTKTDKSSQQILLEWWSNETDNSVKVKVVASLRGSVDASLGEWSCAQFQRETDEGIRSALSRFIISASAMQEPPPVVLQSVKQMIQDENNPRLQYRVLQLIGDMGIASHAKLIENSINFFGSEHLVERAQLTLRQLKARDRKDE